MSSNIDPNIEGFKDDFDFSNVTPNPQDVTPQDEIHEFVGDMLVKATNIVTGMAMGVEGATRGESRQTELKAKAPIKDFIDDFMHQLNHTLTASLYQRPDWKEEIGPFQDKVQGHLESLARLPNTNHIPRKQINRQSELMGQLQAKSGVGAAAPKLGASGPGAGIMGGNFAQMLQQLTGGSGMTGHSSQKPSSPHHSPGASQSGTGIPGIKMDPWMSAVKGLIEKYFAIAGEHFQNVNLTKSTGGDFSKGSGSTHSQLYQLLGIYQVVSSRFNQDPAKNKAQKEAAHELAKGVGGNSNPLAGLMGGGGAGGMGGMGGMGGLLGGAGGGGMGGLLGGSGPSAPAAAPGGAVGSGSGGAPLGASAPSPMADLSKKPLSGPKPSDADVAQFMRAVTPKNTTSSAPVDPSGKTWSDHGQKGAVTHSSTGISMSNQITGASGATSSGSAATTDTIPAPAAGTYEFTFKLTSNELQTLESSKIFTVSILLNGKTINVGTLGKDLTINSDGTITMKFTIPKDAPKNSTLGFNFYLYGQHGAPGANLSISSMSYGATTPTPPPNQQDLQKAYQDLQNMPDSNGKTFAQWLGANLTLLGADVGILNGLIDAYKSATPAAQKGLWGVMESMNSEVQKLMGAIVGDGKYTGFKAEIQDIFGKAGISELDGVSESQLETYFQSLLPAEPKMPEPPASNQAPGSNKSDTEEAQSLSKNQEVNYLLEMLKGDLKTNPLPNDPAFTAVYTAYTEWKSASGGDARTKDITFINDFFGLLAGIVIKDFPGIMKSFPGITANSTGDEADAFDKHIVQLGLLMFSQNGISARMLSKGPTSSGLPNMAPSMDGASGLTKNDTGGPFGGPSYTMNSGTPDFKKKLPSSGMQKGDVVVLSAYVKWPETHTSENGTQHVMSGSIGLDGTGVSVVSQDYGNNNNYNGWQRVQFTIKVSDPNNITFDFNAGKFPPSWGGSTGSIAGLSITNLGQNAEKATSAVNSLIPSTGPGAQASRIDGIKKIPPNASYQERAMAYVNMFTPPPNIFPVGLGHFPELQRPLNPGDSFLDNYSPFYENGVNKYPYYQTSNATITNGAYNSDTKKLDHNIRFNPTGSAKSQVNMEAYGPMPPMGEYQYSFNINLPANLQNFNPTIQISGLDQTNGKPGTNPQIMNVNLMDYIQPKPPVAGTQAKVVLPFSLTKLLYNNANSSASYTNHDWIQPKITITAQAGSPSFTISNVSLTNNDSAAYSKFNSVNPSAGTANSNQKSLWNSKNGVNYPTTTGKMPAGWGSARLSNDIANNDLNPTPTPQGIKLPATNDANNNYNNACLNSNFQTYGDATVSSTVQFQKNPNGPTTYPAFAMWSYAGRQTPVGSSGQAGPAGNAYMDTGENDSEFYAEKINGQVHTLLRFTAYDGLDGGGKYHSPTITVDLTAKYGINLYDGTQNTITMHDIPSAKTGQDTLSVTVTNAAGKSCTLSWPAGKDGVKSHEVPKYWRIGTEAPQWGYKSQQGNLAQTPGRSDFLVSNLSVKNHLSPEQQKKANKAMRHHSTDYSYNTPGGGFISWPPPLYAQGGADTLAKYAAKIEALLNEYPPTSTYGQLAADLKKTYQQYVTTGPDGEPELKTNIAKNGTTANNGLSALQQAMQITFINDVQRGGSIYEEYGTTIQGVSQIAAQLGFSSSQVTQICTPQSVGAQMMEWLNEQTNAGGPDSSQYQTVKLQLLDAMEKGQPTGKIDQFLFGPMPPDPSNPAQYKTLEQTLTQIFGDKNLGLSNSIMNSVANEFESIFPGAPKPFVPQGSVAQTLTDDMNKATNPGVKEIFQDIINLYNSGSRPDLFDTAAGRDALYKFIGYCLSAQPGSPPVTLKGTSISFTAPSSFPIKDPQYTQIINEFHSAFGDPPIPTPTPSSGGTVDSAFSDLQSQYEDNDTIKAILVWASYYLEKDPGFLKSDNLITFGKTLQAILAAPKNNVSYHTGGNTYAAPTDAQSLTTAQQKSLYSSIMNDVKNALG
ncbi:MAG: hypothetical protein MRY21_05900 [Simkaniaceae bacterium]|nr:hypothetical protein [Simkaniaceae bacterium]